MCERGPKYHRRWVIQRLAGAGAALMASVALSSDSEVGNNGNYSSSNNTGAIDCRPAYQHITEPEDLVSSDELLDKYHTRIWNVPGVSLSVRRAALSEEPIFGVLSGEKAADPGSIESLPGLPSSLGKDPRSLDMVLIDGPVVHSSFMTEEQRQGLPWLWEEQRAREKSAYQREVDAERNMHEAEAEYFEELLQKLESKRVDGSMDDASFKQKKERLETSLFMSKSRADSLTGEGVKQGIRVEKGEIGTFGYKIDIKKDPLTGKSQGTLRYYILLAVKPDPIGSNYETDHDNFFARSPLQPLQQWQSYPSESDLTVTSDPVYPVQSDRLGWVLRHEFAHAASLKHPQTDFAARDQIVRARQLLCETGNSLLFYFEFKTPDDLIITRKDDQKMLEG